MDIFMKNKFNKCAKLREIFSDNQFSDTFNSLKTLSKHGYVEGYEIMLDAHKFKSLLRINI